MEFPRQTDRPRLARGDENDGSFEVPAKVPWKIACTLARYFLREFGLL